MSVDYLKAVRSYMYRCRKMLAKNAFDGLDDSEIWGHIDRQIDQLSNIELLEMMTKALAPTN